MHKGRADTVSERERKRAERKVLRRSEKEELTAAVVTVNTVNDSNTSFLKTFLFKLQPD